MKMKPFPVIDPEATGKNILRLRTQRGLTVRDLQTYFGFEEPQAIYKWQKGKSLPSVDHLYALGTLLEVPMEEILVSRSAKLNPTIGEQQESTCCSSHFTAHIYRIRMEQKKSLNLWFDLRIKNTGRQICLPVFYIYSLYFQEPVKCRRIRPCAIPFY